MLRSWLLTVGMVLGIAIQVAAAPPAAPESSPLTSAAVTFSKSLTPEQRNSVIVPFNSPLRQDWHLYPKPERKGLQIKEMTPEQRTAADHLLQAALSKSGYEKVKQVMRFEDLIHELEQGKSAHQRDPERFFYTLFGDPAQDAVWGLSVEGHHLSINLVVKDGKIVSSTPQAMGMNPATVQSENQTGVAVGTRVMAKEEQLAFDLINSLDPEQQKLAIVSKTPPKDARDLGKPRPLPGPAVGIPYSQLTGEQRSLLIQLIREFNSVFPDAAAKARHNRLLYDGVNEIHFAWTGGTGVADPHAFTVEAPSLRIELVNVQKDPLGNPANHLHSVVRDLKHDFTEGIQ